MLGFIIMQDIRLVMQVTRLQGLMGGFEVLSTPHCDNSCDSGSGDVHTS